MKTSPVTKVTFNVPVVGWLINVATVVSPVKRRRRIMIHEGMMLSDGRFTSAVFTMKGRVYELKHGEVVDTSMRFMEVWVNDKWLRNDRTRRFAAWASSPQSETYWSS